MLEAHAAQDQDWSRGLTLFFVGHIPHVQANVVLFDLGEGPLGPKVTIALDEEGRLAFQALDRAHRTASVSIAFGDELTVPFALLCTLAPHPKEPGEWVLSLELNGRAVAERGARLDWPTNARVMQALGGDLAGERTSTFTMAELGVFLGKIEPANKDGLLAYAKSRYALRNVNG